MTDSALVKQSVAALAEGGLFSQAIDRFNPRASQQNFAKHVAQMIEYGGVLVAESGTGTGKTFAYLVPALLSGRKVVISTGTRHLQDQLFHRDLPVVRKVLEHAPDAALLKGRSNYLCLYRLAQLGQDSALKYQKGYANKRTILENWARTTSFGEISEVAEFDEQDPIWRQVTSTTDNCLGSECPDYKKCHVNKARQRAMKAQLVVVNHHLFFADISLKEAGFGELLPDYDVVIFDEAHQIPDVATLFFGFTVSTYQINDLCRDVTVTEAKEKSGVALADVVNQLQASIAPLHLAASKKQRGEGALLCHDASGMSAINGVLDALADVETALSSASVAGDGLLRCHERILQIQGHLLDWLAYSAKPDKMVCWFETSRANTRLTASPLSVGQQMQALLQKPGKTSILTSATLAAGSDFSYYLRQLGLSEVDTAQHDSPFNYADHSLLYLPQNLPEPNDRGFAEALIAASVPVLTASKGRAFMLFTSYNMLHQVAQGMRAYSQWNLFVQGESPRGELIEQFRSTPDAILLGTASFWEGVDIQGEDLSCVIIDKLPFAPPNDPVMRARLNKIEQAGGKPFFEMQIPDAIMTLKQGAGRLIRDESDKGVLMICDARLKSKGYGDKFLQALPPMRRTDSLKAVQLFFEALS